MFGNNKKENENENQVIENNTKITGNIENENELIISGEVEGDITGNIIIIKKGGFVKGNIKCNKIAIKGKVEGDINSEDLLSLEIGSEVLGKIECGRALIKGETESEINVRETLKMESTAKVSGNIKTKDIIVEKGATFNSVIEINSDYKK